MTNWTYLWWLNGGRGTEPLTCSIWVYLQVVRVFLPKEAKTKLKVNSNWNFGSQTYISRNWCEKPAHPQKKKRQISLIPTSYVTKNFFSGTWVVKGHNEGIFPTPRVESLWEFWIATDQCLWRVSHSSPFKMKVFLAIILSITTHGVLGHIICLFSF